MPPKQERTRRPHLPATVGCRITALGTLAKQLSVDTPLGRFGDRARWLLQAPNRARHPELWDLYLEDKRIDLVLSELIGSGDNCVDVGAHVGSKLAAIRRLAPGGRHIAFEPVPSKARWLQRRFRDVEIRQAATTDEIGTGRFYIDLEQPGFCGLSEPLGQSTIVTEVVRLTRLDDELDGWDRIDFVKIDVEGAELPTLRGAKAMLDHHHPNLLFECGTDAQLERFGYTRADLYEFLTEHGYDIHSVGDFVYGRPPLTPRGFETAGTYPYRGFNYVAVPTGTPVRRLA